MTVMRYTVQGGPYGLYIQTYASFLENVVEGVKLGRPALLYVKLVKDSGATYFYYARYGGGLGKLNISIPEWFAGKGERINVFFKAVSDDEFIKSIPSIQMEKHPDKPTVVVEKAVLDKGVLRLFVRQELSEGGTLREIIAEDPVVGFDPRGVEVEEGKYAGAPYVQFTLAGKTLRVYHNHGKTRIAIASGRNFYTVKRIEINESSLRLYYQKKEDRIRLVSTLIELEKTASH
ncbi:MAG: hypothetical protein QXN89_03930 [Candidatus Woesearchaeota archaeon]